MPRPKGSKNKKSINEASANDNNKTTTMVKTKEKDTMSNSKQVAKATKPTTASKFQDFFDFHHLGNKKSIEEVLEYVTIFYQEHIKLMQMLNMIRENKIINGVADVNIKCPNCDSHVLVNIGNCHVCGTTLIDTSDIDMEVPSDSGNKKVTKEEVVDSLGDEDDSDDMFGDDEPVEQKTTTKQTTEKQTTKAPIKDDMFEEDEFDGLVEDDEEPAPAKKSAKTTAPTKSSNKKAVAEDEDDDIFDGLLEDEEETKFGKGNKMTEKEKKAEAAKLPKNQLYEDDDIFDSLDDLEDDAELVTLEDEPVKTKSKSTPAKQTSKAPAVSEDEEEIEFDPDTFDIGDDEDDDFLSDDL